MKNVLRIAWREFTAITSTKAFWIGMAMSPLIGLGFSMMARTMEESQPTRHFVVADPTGEYADLLEDAVTLRHLRGVVPVLRSHYNLYKTADDQQIADWLNNFRGAQQTTIAQEITAAGGVDKLITDVKALLSDQAPPLNLSQPRYQIVDLPPGVKIDEPNNIVEQLRPYLMGDDTIQVADKSVSLYAAVIITPSTDDNNPDVAYWTKNLSNSNLSDFIRASLNRALETERLVANGIEPRLLQDIQSMELNVDRFDISKETDAKESAVDVALRIVPLVFAGMLMILVVINIGLLLQSILEEKSNRLLEVLLSTVSPLQLMLGKLMGVAAVTFLTIFSWLVIIASFVYFSVDASDFTNEAAQAQAMAQAQQAMADAQVEQQFDAGAIDQNMIDAVIEVAVAVVKLIPVFLFYLFCGYLIYSSLILALGSLCSSQQEAQNLTMPIFLFLFMPMFIAPFIIRDPNGTLATVFTWIPFFTPTVILARFDSDLPMGELLGSTALLLLTVIVTVWVSAKVFRYGALHAQQPPKFMTLVKLVFQKEK